MYCLNNVPPYFMTLSEARKAAMTADPVPNMERSDLFRVRTVIYDDHGKIVGGVVDGVEGRENELFYVKYGRSIIYGMDADGNILSDFCEIGVSSQAKYIIKGNDRGAEDIPFPSRESMLRFFIKSAKDLFDGYIAMATENGLSEPTYMVRVDKKTLIYGNDEIGWHRIKAGGKLATGEFKATAQQSRGMDEGRKAMGLPSVFRGRAKA